MTTGYFVLLWLGTRLEGQISSRSLFVSSSKFLRGFLHFQPECYSCRAHERIFAF